MSKLVKKANGFAYLAIEKLRSGDGRGKTLYVPTNIEHVVAQSHRQSQPSRLTRLAAPTDLDVFNTGIIAARTHNDSSHLPIHSGFAVHLPEWTFEERVDVF